MKASNHLSTKLISRVSRASTNLGTKLSTRSKYSSAFDPYWTLHYQNVTREQQEAFRSVWENNTGDFKKELTAEELKQFQRKVDETGAIDDFETLMKGLWGPNRHAWIRQTSTFQYTKGVIMDYINVSSNSHTAALDLIMGDDDKFNDFLSQSQLQSNDIEGYLSDFTYADLRYMCAAIAFDYFGGPTITLVFGNRTQYHYELPDPVGRTAYWQTAIYDRCRVKDIVMLTAVNGLKKPGGVISPKYFRDLLDSLDHNALKEEEWRMYAERQAVPNSEEEFLDDFDRAFNAFQTTPGVTNLRTRFASDWDRFKI